MEQRKRSRMVKTPICGIPIGEAIKKPDGHYSLRIKKSGGSDEEEIALDQLFTLVMNKAESA